MASPVFHMHPGLILDPTEMKNIFHLLEWDQTFGHRL